MNFLNPNGTTIGRVDIRMTTEEMVTIGREAGKHILTSDSTIGMINKLVCTVWFCCAEVCERLDKLNSTLKDSKNEP